MFVIFCHLDLYTTEIRHWWAGIGSDASELLINDGQEIPSFARPGREALGLSLSHGNNSWDEGHITAASIDFDNDGLLDIYLVGTDYPGNRGHLYHNQSQAFQAQFSEVATRDAFEHNRSHGVVVADFDRYGDLDIIVGHSRMRCGLEGDNPCYESMQIRAFKNVLANQGQWIHLSLEGGTGSNRDAIGARVEARPILADGSVSETAIVRYVKGGYGHFGQQSQRSIHLGLGQACEAEVTITWPNADLSPQTLRLLAGEHYFVSQGNDAQVLDRGIE